MALLVECPKCKLRNSMKNAKCKCAFNIRKAHSKVYWIEYYADNGKRRRERIGNSKEAAQNRLRNVLKARTEGRYIDKDPAITTSLKSLCAWYLSLPEVKAKKSYKRDIELIRNLKRILGEATKIDKITEGIIESYKLKKLSEPSPRRKNQNIKPATVNREITCLKCIFNRAIKHNRLKVNPISKVKKLKENNVRMRILTQEEFEKLFNACPFHLKPIVITAYYTGMRRGEIINLTWANIDLKKGFIKLSADMTKTAMARSVPLHPRVKAILKRLPKAIHTDRVFLYRNNPFTEIKRAFTSACKHAGIKDFTFHDLRHCALNNMRLAGNDYFRIMAVSGHKTTSVFKRYNLVTEAELSQIKWLDETDNKGTMDTYIDTREKNIINGKY